MCDHDIIVVCFCVSYCCILFVNVHILKKEQIMNPAQVCGTGTIFFKSGIIIGFVL